MVKMSEINREMEQQGVSLILYKIGFAKAATLEIGQTYGIFLDKDQQFERAELKGILAHELGHCCTGATHKVSSPLDLIARHEYKANRWAYERFLPFEKFQQAAQMGLVDWWEFSEFFDLPEAFVRDAFAYYTECRGLRL